MYEYRARVTRVVDGDTYDFEVDLGFNIKFNQRFRLINADTPEVYGRYASDDGHAVSDIVRSILYHNGPILTVHTYKDKKDKYGRYLVDVDIEKDENGNDILTEMNREDGTRVTLSQYLIMNGLAEKYE